MLSEELGCFDPLYPSEVGLGVLKIGIVPTIVGCVLKVVAVVDEGELLSLKLFTGLPEVNEDIVGVSDSRAIVGSWEGDCVTLGEGAAGW